MTSQERAALVMIWCDELGDEDEPDNGSGVASLAAGRTAANIAVAIDAAVAEERQRCVALAAAALGDDYGLAIAILAEVK